MAGQLKLRRGTTSQLAHFIGSEGELTYNTTLKSLVLHDGVTLGGVKIPYLSNNLVPSTMLPTATESVIGASKIATTAIAQAGTNDTDIITAKKLRDALKAGGNAPISAVRAYCAFNGASAPVIYNESNVLSITVAGSTAALLKFTVTFKTPMPTKDYAISGFCSDVVNSNRLAGITMNPDDIINKTVNGFDFWCRYTSGSSSNIAPALITFTIVC